MTAVRCCVAMWCRRVHAGSASGTAATARRAGTTSSAPGSAPVSHRVRSSSSAGPPARCTVPNLARAFPDATGSSRVFSGSRAASPASTDWAMWIRCAASSIFMARPTIFPWGSPDRRAACGCATPTSSTSSTACQSAPGSRSLRRRGHPGGRVRGGAGKLIVTRAVESIAKNTKSVTRGPREGRRLLQHLNQMEWTNAAQGQGFHHHRRGERHRQGHRAQIRAGRRQGRGLRPQAERGGRGGERDQGGGRAGHGRRRRTSPATPTSRPRSTP